MKKLLLLPILAIMIVGCYNDDFDRVDADIAQLQADLEQTSLNNALIITQLQENFQGTIDTAIANATAALASATEALEAADTANQAAIAAVVSDLADVTADLEAVEANQTAYTAAAGQTAANLSALARAIGTLQDDVEDLEDDVDDLEDDLDDLDDDVNTITWTPTFSTQTANFVQTGVSVTGTTSRSINIGTTTATIVINSVEHQHNVDINGDRDQADSIRRSRIDTTYTGLVSGTTLSIGSHTVTGTLTPWIVVDNN